MASQEAIKNLGTNGGGFFNANSAHPFENPNALSNLFEIFLLLVIPFCLPARSARCSATASRAWRCWRRWRSSGSAAVALTVWAELSGRGTAAQLAGAAMEGKETRFGVWASALFAASTTGTSTGAVNAMHDSMTARRRWRGAAQHAAR